MKIRLTNSTRVSLSGLLLAAMLVLGFGGLDWEFPWWLWLLAILDTMSSTHTE